MSFTQQFIINGRYLGTAERKHTFTHGQITAPSSYAFFCPHCANIWARCPVTQKYTEATSFFQVLSIPCERCPMRLPYHIPGSVFLSWDKEFSEAFPDELIAHEFNQAVKLYEGVL